MPRYLLSSLVLAAACAGGDAPAAGPVVRDSAGVTIVQNTSPQWRDGQAWAVSPRPVFDLGESEDDPNQQFLRIAAVSRLSDGRIVVADQTSDELRFFSPTGQHLLTAGGSGGGPGEFGFLGGLALVPGDTLVASNFPPAGRTAWFAPDGSFVRQQVWDVAALVPPTLFTEFGQPLPDGSWLMWVHERIEAPLTGAHRSRFGLWRVASADAPPDTLGWFEGREFFYDRGGARSVAGPTPFTSHTLLTWTRDHFFVAESGQYEIRRLRYDGMLDLVIRRVVDAPPVTAADRDEFRELILEFARQQNREPAYQRWLAQITYPATKPPIDALVADRLGNLWVRTTERTADTSRTWTVFDREGRLLGDVALPAELCEPVCGTAGASLLEIGSNYVLAVVRDDLDVEHVRLYQLTKP